MPYLKLSLHQECDQWPEKLTLGIEGCLQKGLDHVMDILPPDQQQFYANGVAVSVLLTHDAKMKRLNFDYRAKDKTTNILSFPAPAIMPKIQGQPYFLGDLALSYQCLSLEAKAQMKEIINHFHHLLIHGLLHLLGYDHEDEMEALEMEEVEISILQAQNIPNPYEADYIK